MKEIEAKELFQGIPVWNRVFENLDKDIAKYERYDWNEVTTKERLIEKRERLTKVAQVLTVTDLMMLYYMKNGLGIGVRKVYALLRKQYCARRELENALKGEEEVWDIEEVGIKVKKFKKMQKNP